MLLEVGGTEDAEVMLFRQIVPVILCFTIFFKGFGDFRWNSWFRCFNCFPDCEGLCTQQKECKQSK